jgi:LPXTG-site transpeptidase (sortase) family protein
MPQPPEVAGGRAPALPRSVEHLGVFSDAESDSEAGVDLAPAPVQAEAEPLEPRPITHLALPRIGVDTEVVPAPFVVQGDSGNWYVPPYVAGHAEYTAGAGEPGNAVLLGHVTSISLGNVFEKLDRIPKGDVIRVASGNEEFQYRVSDVLRVSRTDVSVLDQTDVPTVSLITCTGLWLPHLHDYAERLVVRGTLVG